MLHEELVHLKLDRLIFLIEERIVEKLDENFSLLTQRNLEIMATLQNALDAIAALSADVDKGIADLQAAIAAAQAANPAVDFQPIIDAVSAVDAKIKAADATAVVPVAAPAV